jgi:hypothetical protein
LGAFTILHWQFDEWYYPRMSDVLPQNLGRRVGDLSDLPAELRAELQVAKIGELEQQIIAVLMGLDGVANVDEILVGLWRSEGKLLKRQYVANKLYRMGQARQIASVPKKKGVYRTIVSETN